MQKQIRILVFAVCAVLAGGIGIGFVARSRAAAQGQSAEMLAVVTAFNQARELCYATPDCANLDALAALFTDDARRTEVNRANDVVQLLTPEALRADSLRVARSFTGRRLETTSMLVQGRNVIVQQLNHDPGAAQPGPFTHVFRVQNGRIAHWILVAP